MDITHLSSCDRYKYCHVIMDTFSHFVYASCRTSEKTADAIQVLKQAMLCMGVPWALKTDNSPAYASAQFKRFCQSWHISHTSGIPYNPQGQTIIKRANRMLKGQLKKGGGEGRSPQEKIAAALFTVNFLTFDTEWLTPAYKDWGHMQQFTPQPLVLWRDPLTNQLWGLCPLLRRG